MTAAAWLTGAELSHALSDLRGRYQREVRAIAGRLALDFQARRFDATKPEEDWEGDYPFNLLEHLCETLPICCDSRSARAVLLVSRYADEAVYREVEAGATTLIPGRAWAGLASHCLARDVHDYAIRRGWSRRTERGTSWARERSVRLRRERTGS